jgi:hypothetical protein
VIGTHFALMTAVLTILINSIEVPIMTALTLASIGLIGIAIIARKSS